jgi:hypothetical protein
MTNDDNDDLRALWREQKTDDVDVEKLAALRKRGDKLTRKLALRKWSETIAGVLVGAFFATSALHTTARLQQLAIAMILVGEAIVLRNLWRRGTPRPAPPPGVSTVEYLAYYRAELVRERDLLGSVIRWYLAPMAPGLVFLPIAVCIDLGRIALWTGSVTIASVALVFIVVAAVNHRQSRKLAREIDALDGG